MKFDEVLIQLGEFGFYQKRLYLILCIPAISVGCYMMILVYIMHAPEHRCKIPGYDNDTYEIQNSYHQHLINTTIPPPLDEHSIHKYDRCHIYVNNDVNADPTSVTRIKCTEWVYDTSTFEETFTSKNNLVCSEALKTSHAQMIFYFGVLVGDIGFGMLSDVIGRKKTLVISAVIQVSAAVGVAFAPEFYSFVILEFIVGAACHGVFMAACVLSVEFVGPSKRVMTGIPIHIFFAIGLVYLSLMGFLLRNWQYLQLSVAVPCIVYVFYWWIIPESPRWLVSQGKYADAETIVQVTAKANKAKIPNPIIDPKTIEVNKGGKLWHMFTHKVLLLRMLKLLYNWIIVAMIYYGVTMHVGNLGGDFYLNQFILAAVEFPSKIGSMLLLNKIGRRKMHCTCLHPLTLTLSFIGKTSSAAAFGVIYIFSAELYPTIVRNGAMGASSCIARFGGMAAPYIAQTNIIHHSGEWDIIVYDEFPISTVELPQ
ncbi:hypothetical protein FSP39_011541 [Pinctada imbricata]|uniref:Major facilitator superfamily (MFS) profile domain-containing protein n=1 Tax=Pinctada imbricata TaxID=66713 RepID=A0AA88Y8R9_PINIB|nr:hypothetical protein FSP39_011541 [Pinctada imbricata]